MGRCRKPGQTLFANDLRVDCVYTEFSLRAPQSFWITQLLTEQLDIEVLTPDDKPFRFFVLNGQADEFCELAIQALKEMAGRTWRLRRIMPLKPGH